MNDLIFGGSASKASKNIALVSLILEVDKENINDSIMIDLMSLFCSDHATTPDSLAWLRITDEDVFSFQIHCSNINVGLPLKFIFVFLCAITET